MASMSLRSMHAVRAPLHSEAAWTCNFDATANIELSGVGYAEASYFGQVCSTGLTKEGTECIMGEPQVGSMSILNFPLEGLG
jgi:hypothetical protein